jgi:hypothetical protein
VARLVLVVGLGVGASSAAQAAGADPTPVSGPVTGGTVVSDAAPLGVLAVAGGEVAGYGLGSDGSIYAWGDNSLGQLGDGTTTNRSVPVLVDTSGRPAGALPFLEVSAGAYSGYGLGSDGNIYAWGHNQWGQLGDGTTDGSSVPVSDGVWQATTPPGCGPVDVVVRFSLAGDPSGAVHEKTYTDGFVYGSPPTITTQPVITGPGDGTRSATVAVSGDDTPAVRWQSSTDTTTWTDLPGQASSTLDVPAVKVSTAFRAVATSCWSALDPAAYTAISDTITVEPPGTGQDGGQGLAATGATGVLTAVRVAVLLVTVGTLALLVTARRRRHA